VRKVSYNSANRRLGPHCDFLVLALRLLTTTHPTVSACITNLQACRAYVAGDQFPFLQMILFAVVTTRTLETARAERKAVQRHGDKQQQQPRAQIAIALVVLLQIVTRYTCLVSRRDYQGH